MAEQRAHRRLAAIVAADVVGYSRLIDLDEQGTLAALNERRKGILEPLVREHHSRIVKLMGDGVLVEFASAVNAVSCAVEFNRRIAEANQDFATWRNSWPNALSASRMRQFGDGFPSSVLLSPTPYVASGPGQAISGIW